GVLLGTAAALGTAALGAAPAAAASPPRQARPRAVFGMPLPGGLVCPVQYLSRAGWGADESYRYYPGHEDWPIEPNLPQTITVHHTGFAASADPAETVRTIYRQQALPASMGGIQGWGDIGYHLLIDADGVVYEGRYSGSDQWPVFDPTGWYVVTGAHVLGYNTGNIGVCLLGYLNDAPPTQAAQDALVTVLAYLAEATGIDPLATVNYHNPVNGNQRTVRAISGHRDWDATDCPGHALYPLLGGIRQQVASSMPSAQPTPTQTQTPTTEPTSSEPTTG
ncbi:MAG: N-acetylmuramoyl-L-alanine amidase, partial [Micromonosporaceae bacterium]|nr:N-acetylmuramoyl-L-alanine amidase [Micromonosporaceae bacterium]